MERIKSAVSQLVRWSVMKASGGNGSREHVTKTPGESGWERWRRGGRVTQHDE